MKAVTRRFGLARPSAAVVRIALCVSLLLAACSRVTYENPTTRRGSMTQQTGNYFLFGLIGKTHVWANRMCPNGVHRVQSKFTPVDVAIAMLTASLWSPRTYQVECAR